MEQFPSPLIPDPESMQCSPVVIIGFDATLSDATQLLVEERLVLEEGRVIGQVTQQAVLRFLSAQSKLPGLTVAEMLTPIQTISQADWQTETLV
jgi:hypothetical protein